MKKLVIYTTTGYPDKNFTIDLALSLADVGVDAIELGVAFSDPVADGAVIERANQIALKNGFKLSDTFEVSRAISDKIDTLWMGYYNPFYQYGFENLVKKAAELGVSGLIIPDLPYEEAILHDDIFRANAISNISFVAPTDSDERIKKIISDAEKFIYLVAYTGITGSGKDEDLSQIIENIRKYTTTPVYVGFGVNEKTARERIKGADGVIVGSALVNILLDETMALSDRLKKATELSKNIKEIINS